MLKKSQVHVVNLMSRRLWKCSSNMEHISVAYQYDISEIVSKNHIQNHILLRSEYCPHVAGVPVHAPGQVRKHILLRSEYCPHVVGVPVYAPGQVRKRNAYTGGTAGFTCGPALPSCGPTMRTYDDERNNFSILIYLLHITNFLGHA